MAGVADCRMMHGICFRQHEFEFRETRDARTAHVPVTPGFTPRNNTKLHTRHSLLQLLLCGALACRFCCLCRCSLDLGQSACACARSVEQSRRDQESRSPAGTRRTALSTLQNALRQGRQCSGIGSAGQPVVRGRLHVVQARSYQLCQLGANNQRHMITCH